MFAGKYGDSRVTFFEPQKLSVAESIRVEHNTFVVNCTTAAGVSVYENLHAHPLMASNTKVSTPTEDQLSVEVIVIESVSMSQFRRKMPATLDFVTDQMKMLLFESKPG